MPKQKKRKKPSAAKPTKKANYPKLTPAKERQIRSETAFVAKSASTTTKKAKPKTKPKRKSRNTMDHPHSSHKWGPSYNKFMQMNEVNVVRRKPKEI